MENNTMELNLEEMEQVSGSVYCSESVPGSSALCKHPNKVKTSIEYEEEFFIFWTRHRCVYLCPDCHKVVLVFEDP